jgi:hypothetical protein
MELLRRLPVKADQKFGQEEDSSEANDKMNHKEKKLDALNSNSKTLKKGCTLEAVMLTCNPSYLGNGYRMIVV